MHQKCFFYGLSLWLFIFAGSLHAQQNVTVAAVDPADRLAGSTVLGEWTADGDLDGWTGTEAAGLTSAGGYLTGSDASTTLNTSVSLGAITSGPDLDFGLNDYLQIRLKLPASYTGDVRIPLSPSVLRSRPSCSIVRSVPMQTIATSQP